MRRGGLEPRLALALGLFALGAAVAGTAVAWLLARRGMGRPLSARLAASILLLAVLTIGLGAFLLFCAHALMATGAWGRPFSPHWVGSMIVNSGAALIYTITFALPMLIPLGLPVLLVAAIVLARPVGLSAARSPVRPRATPEPGRDPS